MLVDALPQKTLSRLVSSVRETAERIMNDKDGVNVHTFVPRKGLLCFTCWAYIG